jgi:hypothetical protein
VVGEAMSSRSLLRSESGMVAIWVAASLAAMIGIIALSLDLGRMATTDSELKWAADAAALAGARQLDGEAGARNRARLAATGAVAGPGVGLTSNGDSFDENDASVSVVDVKFLSKLGPGDGTAGDVEAIGDADARYIQVVVEQTVLNNLFIQVVGGSDTSTVQQSSVAGFGSAICRIPPLMLCNPYEQTNPGATLPPGMGIQVKDGGGNSSQWGPGNYALLEIPGLPGADAIRASFAALNGSPVCFDPDLVTTKPGQSVAVNAGLNVRLDMYSGNTNGLKSSPTHYPAKNVVKGLGTRAPSATKCDPKIADYDLYTGEGDAAELMQYPRDKCFYTGTCAVTGAGTRYGDGQWDKAAYCQTNYGDATCAGVASPTGKPINTRYGFYRAEVESGVVPQTANENVKNLCYTGKTWDQLPIGADAREVGFETSVNGPDRRVVVAAMVNCNQQKALGNLNGHKTVEVYKWVLLFLTEAAGQYGDQTEMFFEVIREMDMENDQTYAHDIVQLYR